MAEEKKFEILIVDDNSLTRQIIIDMLKTHVEYSVYEAENVWTAIRKLGNHQVDLILLDIYMPDINGFDAVKIIRSQKKTAHTTIVFMTAQDPNNEFKQMAFDLGGIDYILKPFKEHEISRLLTLYQRFILRERAINKEIAEANKKLQNEIHIRIQTEESLRVSESALKKTNLAKDRFFSILAHDLINPFSILLNASKQVHDYYKDFSSDDLFEMIGFMKTASEQTYSLLSNLLEWSRTQMNAIKYTPANIDLYNISQSQIDILGSVADNKNISLINEIDNDNFVFVDANMIKTVIRNLITNAIKFTHDGGTITLSVNPYLDFSSESTVEREYLEVCIKDNGIGISEEIQLKLFKLEENFTSFGTNNEKGTGLGLLLCQEFVEKNNGKIWVESQVGYGSSFKFTLPAGE